MKNEKLKMKNEKERKGQEQDKQQGKFRSK
jgi:hypothetical protein